MAGYRPFDRTGVRVRERARIERLPARYDTARPENAAAVRRPRGSRLGSGAGRSP